MDTPKTTTLKEAYLAQPGKMYLGVTSLISVLAVIAAIVTAASTPSQAAIDYRNCAEDAIVSCGALTQDELVQKYDKDLSGVQNIYAHYGITRDDLIGKTSQLKRGAVYQDGHVAVGGKTVATKAYSLSRKALNDKNGNAPRTVSINSATFYEGPNMSIFARPVDAYALFRNGQFYRAIISSSASPVMAVAAAQPVFSCDSLKADAIGRSRYRFAAAASASGTASVADYTYDFGDGTKANGGKTVDHQYAQPGTYTVKMAANIKLMGETKTVTNEHCVTAVTLSDESKTPFYTCNSLSATPVIGTARTYAYTPGYTAEGGAHLAKVDYDFGDGTKKSFELKDAFTATHRYDIPGTYTATTTLYFTVPENGATVEKSANCTATVSVETPAELPKTGLGAWMSGLLGLAAIAGAGYYYLASHKNLRDKLLKHQ